jgi:hypothetical protein
VRRAKRQLEAINWRFEEKLAGPGKIAAGKTP